MYVGRINSDNHVGVEGVYLSVEEMIEKLDNVDGIFLPEIFI
jgi:hypothetical protein